MDEGQQKHQKVYSFLKRTLRQERYEGIRVIEPCVIVADGFNKAFKFAVLGNEMIYITENPPKLAKDIRITIDLANITNVEMIHDVPDFLAGELKTQVQHILITYSSSLDSNPKPSQSSSSQCQELTSQGVAFQSSFLTASALLGVDLDKQIQPTISGSFTERGIRDEVESARRFYSRSTKISASEGNIPWLLERERLHASTTSLQTEKSNYLCVPRCGRPLPPPPANLEQTTSNSLPSASLQRHRKTRRKQNKDSQELNSSSSSNELDFSQYRNEFTNDNLHEKNMMSSCYNQLDSQRGSTLSKTGNSNSVDYSTSLHDAESSIKESGGVGDKHEDGTQQLHMYILEEGSPMFVLLKSTWNNCILKSTLRFGEQATHTSSSRTMSKVDNSQLLTLFNQLKTEILDSHRLEKTFVLINELLTAAQKSFSLKKLFWKSPELFQFIVDQVLIYLPHSPSRSSKRRGNNRADEFDFVVILLDCLVCMFRETEILSSRLNVLKANKGKAVKDLLQSILATPTISRRSEHKISPAAQMLLMGSSEDLTESKREEETNHLLHEITDCSTAMLYELVAAAHQAKNFPVEGNTLNICWLVKILDSSISMELFLERMMERQMTIISSAKKHLLPKHAVLLYRQLYILHNIMEYSDYMAATIPRSYAEEFRYYIKEPIIKKKLSSKYPLTPPILSLLDKVTCSVLKNKSRVSFR